MCCTIQFIIFFYPWGILFKSLSLSFLPVAFDQLNGWEAKLAKPAVRFKNPKARLSSPGLCGGWILSKLSHALATPWQSKRKQADKHTPYRQFRKFNEHACLQTLGENRSNWSDFLHRKSTQTPHRKAPAEWKIPTQDFLAVRWQCWPFKWEDNVGFFFLYHTCNRDVNVLGFYICFSSVRKSDVCSCGHTAPPIPTAKLAQTANQNYAT